jgi:hypothetical protein
MRRGFLCLVAFNVGMAIGGVTQHRWVDAIAATIWALNCLWVFGALNVQQKTRDRGREIEAALRQVLVDDD